MQTIIDLQHLFNVTLSPFTLTCSRQNERLNTSRPVQNWDSLQQTMARLLLTSIAKQNNRSKQKCRLQEALSHRGWGGVNEKNLWDTLNAPGFLHSWPVCSPHANSTLV